MTAIRGNREAKIIRFIAETTCASGYAAWQFFVHGSASASNVSISTPQFATLFKAHLARQLADAGFEMAPTGDFRGTLCPGVYSHFGLRLYTEQTTSQLAAWPIVGIRFHELERIVAALKDREFYEYGSYTIGKPLGFLMNSLELAQWLVGSEADVVETADNIMSAFELYGRPFIDGHASLESAISEMSPDELGGSHDGERLAAAYVLLGRREDALTVLDHQLARLETGGYPDVDEFRRYSDRIRRHMTENLA